ncbi:MAG: phosphotransferase family protein [Bacteroidetes bacterium]|nr:MAG: phosphotransferase family protein [Bacteroidota bacterium]TAG89656.1 MAG: phosphotransferase family protein [Bacteroidota bacterium]
MNTDEAKNIREGEEIPLEKLALFLNNTLKTNHLPLEILQFPGGYSNLTYLLKLGEKELVLRRPPKGAAHIHKGHDMQREHKVLSLMNKCYEKSPKTIVYSDDLDIIGSPFYVMKRIKGTILRARQNIDIEKQTAKKLSQNLIQNLADMHNIDIYETKLIEIGKPEGYLERQISGWIQRYNNAKTDEITDMDFVTHWLASNQKENQSKPTFLHNDYKYDNVVLDENNLGEIIGVLDWEMSTVGDSNTDFGIALGYLPEKNDSPLLVSLNVPIIDGMLSRQEAVEIYEDKRKQKVDNLVFYYAFALFKLAVVLQQIYYRYQQGFTKDERFKPLIFIVKDCVMMAKKAIQLNKISNF